jgi:hypothetical protein
MDLIGKVKDWWGARKRGEVRTHPFPARGRVFARKDGQPGGGPELPVKGKLIATISAVVIRADGTREDLGEIAGPDQTQVMEG